MRIPFQNLIPNNELSEKLEAARARVFEAGRFIGGEEVEAFEYEWAKYIGAEHCVTCGNGFDAIRMSLLAHRIGFGEQVAVPTLTCLPTWAAVEASGAWISPVDGDVLFDNYQDSTVIPVHLYGIPAKIDYNPYNHLIIEDAAQAHGSLYPDGKKVGSKNTTAWSFYPTKNLGCYGDGGAITTNDNLIAAYLRELRNYGGDHAKSGVNSRLDSLQAAYLRVKLQYLDQWNARRRAIARMYMDGIIWSNWTITEGDKVEAHYLLPWLPAENKGYPLTNFHQFVVVTESRDEFRSYLDLQGIETMVHYAKPPHKALCFSAYKKSCPRADAWSANVVSLPVAPHLTDEQVEYIINTINTWVKLCQ